MEVKYGMFFIKIKILIALLGTVKKDTIAVAQIILRLRNEELLIDDEILTV